MTAGPSIKRQALVVSPQADKVKKALSVQKYPSKKVVQSICSSFKLILQTRAKSHVVNVVSHECIVYPATTSIATFAELVDNPRSYNILQDSGAPLRCDLIFDPSSKPKFGGFKRAVFGHTSVTVIGSQRVCIKQCFYRNPGSTDKHLYGKNDQIEKLCGEINCIRWAAAAMHLVYEFIDFELAAYGPAPFEIPRMRFVNVALAVAQNSEQDIYLLEERIGDDDGEFRKYIPNNSALPLPTSNADERVRADFLSFAQHVQYNKTKQMIFVSDFQGEPVSNYPCHVTYAMLQVVDHCSLIHK
jgi:hypothetical protein